MAAKKPPAVRAKHQPIARVVVDVPLAHLDRPFDYLVSVEQDEQAVPGCRVKVMFAGQRVSGYVVERVETTTFTGRLSYLNAVVSSEPVLSAEVLTLSQAIAARYAGSLADVLRLAIPPRNAEVEKTPPAGAGEPVAAPETQPWRRYQHGEALLSALSAGRSPRAVWQISPGDTWADRLAELAATTAHSGRGAVIVVPDAADLNRLDAALTRHFGGGSHHVALAAGQGPRRRYRHWLRARRGEVPIVIGTRAAAFAHVANLGLVVILDDGDDVHADRHAPYPHAREVLLTRAQQQNCAALVAGYARTPEAQLLIDAGWAHPVQTERAALRTMTPRIVAVDDVRPEDSSGARLPTNAWRAARESLANGAPVLVQVPRRGYIQTIACIQCRHNARCPHCAGPLRLPSANAAPQCGWCGRAVVRFRCRFCGAHRLKAGVIGANRTAEELGRAFPDTVIRTSDGEHLLTDVGSEPALIVATPGAEPVAAGGYGAALLLDPWALLSRPDLRATQETLRRWCAAAALVRPAGQGGQVIVTADSALPVVQALMRWDPAWFAQRELSERAELSFPPAVRLAQVIASADALAEFERDLLPPPSAEVIGPVPYPEDETKEQLLVRAPRREGLALAHALKQVQAARSARRATETVRVVIDPRQLG